MQAERKETISSHVSAWLRGEIIEGRLPPGEKINLDRLRTGRGISISPLREAMARLEAEGLVEFEDQKGFRVAPASLDDLTEVTLLLGEVAPLALRLAMDRAELDWESRLIGALHRLARSPSAEQDHALDDVYRVIVGGCANAHLIRHCHVLLTLLLRYRRIYGAMAATAGSLEGLVSDVGSGDTTAACARLRQHLIDVSQGPKEMLATK